MVVSAVDQRRVDHSACAGEWIRRGSTYVVGREHAARARDNALLYALVLICATALLAWGGRTALSACWAKRYCVTGLCGPLTACVVLQRCGQAILLGQDRCGICARARRLYCDVRSGECATVAGRRSADGARAVA